MKALVYYISLPFIYLVSLLPFWWLYRLSDFLFFILYHLVGYRKEVVTTNLKNSFPEKTEDELKTIRQKFYRYFCDLIVETLKSLTISPEKLQKRISFNSKKVFQKYYDQKQSLIVVMGHWGNWEIGGARFASEPYHKLYVIYHPLRNKYYDELIYRMRTRLGNRLYSMKDTLRGMIRNKTQITATAFIADQTPSPAGAYWLEFLNQDTPFFTGAGVIANKMNYPVIYVGVKKIKRGYYEISFKELVAEPAKLEPIEIMELFSKQLEKDIRMIPEIWLWSHRRWKHQRPL